MKLPWPEMESLQRPGERIRQVLDYLVWITAEMRRVGFHAGSERDHWRRKAREAYTALFLPPVPGCGDPYPPDVPPARNPGIWPDVPADGFSGMTLRHQLKVTGMLCEQLRARVWLHARQPEVEEWDRRLCRAREALDHGTAHPMPEAALTVPSAEGLAAAEEQERAIRAHARRRTKRLKRLTDTGGRSTSAKSKKTAAPRSAAATKKGAKASSTGPRRKTSVKSARPKGTPKVKAAPKKAAPRKQASRKPRVKK